MTLSRLYCDDMVSILASLLVLGSSGPTILRLDPPVIYAELGGSKPELSPSTCAFSILGRGFKRRDRCKFDKAEVTTKFRNSHRLDVIVTVDQVLKKSGQADGTAAITVWDPILKKHSNALTLKTRYRSLGG